MRLFPARILPARLFPVRNGTAALVAAVGAALLAPATLPASAQQLSPRPGAALKSPGNALTSAPLHEGSVRAADLLAGTRKCQQISKGKYRADGGARADVPVCGTRDAVHWKADMDIDCDGQRTKACNRRTDPLFLHATAYQQSDGRQLNAERLPYVVVPGPSRRWNHAAHGITGGTVAAVIHRGQVLYAVVGDTGPTDLIGEASYAAARALGIRADPRTGGAASDVTYIFFKGHKATPIESHRAAVARGDALARQFVQDARAARRPG
ncbi:glycoside hydrolase family 75 protein [Streptomyces sp. NPDC046465]|uniref:glycoside hydrolase family 75 protein n=1 Tax=Streptomyces sp. NPDC046465 TaxID=3155810 RepID=UPI0033E4A089